MKNCKSLKAVRERERERELQFSKIELSERIALFVVYKDRLFM